MGALVALGLAAALVMASPTARRLLRRALPTAHEPGGGRPSDEARPFDVDEPAAPRESTSPRSDRALPACGEDRAWSGAEPARDRAPAPHDDPNAADVEQQADRLTNAARQDHGLDALAFDEALRAIARRHSEHMAEASFFSHDDPEGRSPGDRVHDGHRTLIGEAGENIWMCRGCYRGDPEATSDAVVIGRDGWMNSPGHRANILREKFTHAAVGVAQHGADAWATQVFASAEGHLFAAVPTEVAQDDCMLVEMTPYPEDAEPATAFELVALPSERPIVDPTPLGFTKLTAPPGRYRLRFHFPLTARRYAIVRGPSVEVRVSRDRPDTR